MLLGPKYIYQCPNCDNLLSRNSLMSGNTMLSQQYSDGKVIAMMLPEFPSVTICSKCDNIFWIKKAKEIGSYSLEYPDPKNPVQNEWKNAEEVGFLTIDEYFSAVDNEIYSTKDEELFLRVRIWWGFNDRVRKGGNLFNTDNEKFLWEKNAKILLNLLNNEDINENIMIADLNRNLGNFEECLKIINNLGTDFDWLKPAFINECSKGNDQVFQIIRPQ